MKIILAGATESAKIQKAEHKRPRARSCLVSRYDAAAPVTFAFVGVLILTMLPLYPLPVHAQSPVPASPVIASLIWAPPSSIVRRAAGSDNWPVTWADDGNLYTVYGDGWGFEPRLPSKMSLGFAKITGSASDFQGLNIRSSTGEQKGGGKRGKKASGLLMVDGVLYMWVRNANNAGEECQLAWSTDYALTWTWSAWRFKELGYCAFLNFGQNFKGARDGYVYMYSPNSPSAYNETDQVILTRVPKDQITIRAAYEFFKGLNENKEAQWTTSIKQRGAVFLFPGGCNRLDVTYNAPLGRYLMTMRSRARVGGRNQFSIYDAPEPWGPWTTVFYTESWDVDPGEAQHLPTKWISSDGSTLHLVFSGKDSFSVRQATLTLSGNAPTETSQRTNR